MYLDCKGIIPNLYYNPKVLGIAFSGNHDGNVLFIKEDAIKKVVPLQYCVMDIKKSTDPKAFIVPWAPVSKLRGGTVASGNDTVALKDVLAANSVPPGHSATFNEVYAQVGDNSGVAIVNGIKSSFPWAKNLLNVFHGLNAAFDINHKWNLICLALPCFLWGRFHLKDYIFGGKWERGECPVKYFGTPNDIKQELNALGRTELRDTDDTPVFYGGVFCGDEFRGKFLGGIFKHGIFNGDMYGGRIDFDAGAKWGPLAKRVKEGKFKCIVTYNGQNYDAGDDTPDKFLLKLKARSAAGGAGVDSFMSLAEVIESKLPFKVKDFIIQNNWRGSKDVVEGYKLFREAYPWLWRGKITWKELPVIKVDDKRICVEEGTVWTGSDMHFDEWGPATVVRGGNVYGNVSSKKCIFKGTFVGGNFREGIFDGTYTGGTLYLDNFTWERHAVWAWKKKGYGIDKLSFYYKGRQAQFDEEILRIVVESHLFGAAVLPLGEIPLDDKKNLKYEDPEALFRAVKSGEIWKDIGALLRAKLFFKQGKGPDPQRTMLSSMPSALLMKSAGITKADVNAADATDEWADQDGSQQESRQARLASFNEDADMAFDEEDADIASDEEGSINHDACTDPEGAADDGECYNDDILEVDLEELSYALGRYRLKESEFYTQSLSDTEQERLYAVFSDTYNKTVGASFSLS